MKKQRIIFYYYGKTVTKVLDNLRKIYKEEICLSKNHIDMEIGVKNKIFTKTSTSDAHLYSNQDLRKLLVPIIVEHCFPP